MGSRISERRDWPNPTAFMPSVCPPASSCAGAETEVEGKRPRPPPCRHCTAHSPQELTPAGLHPSGEWGEPDTPECAHK